MSKTAAISTNLYAKFDCLDGEHPWMTQVSDGFVSYRVRELQAGQVIYFNYVLAKEMGLLSPDHLHEMTTELHQKLIDTFSLQIINEYDELAKRRYEAKTIKPKKYMATRYLQLQHSNKKGGTSGDGRGIWNGVVKHRGKVWDVSSRGTGVTCLAPGAVEANKPLKTGSTEFGYGCGLAEIDELLGAALMAETMHLQGVHTERVLCVINLGKGVGIGVRAAQNLIRPAHLFLYLKQGKYKSLKAAADYFIDRQKQNQRWQFKSKDLHIYDELLKYLAQSYAQFAARLEIDYIFAWLDWDGDNVLADAGIIDYGSVRQFGLRHDKYRYDDVDRYSTNLNEQKRKAKLIVQTFCQMCDYLKTGVKKPLHHFSKAKALSDFESYFLVEKEDRLLYRMGFDKSQREKISLKTKETFKQFYSVFSYFERAKVSGNPVKVPDGINHPALFNMRKALFELPRKLINDWQGYTAEELYKTMLSCFAKKRDARMGIKQKIKVYALQELYQKLILASADLDAYDQKILNRVLNSMIMRSEQLNSKKRLTGNALIEIVNELLKELNRGLETKHVQKLIDRLLQEHLSYPEVQVSRYFTDINQNGPEKRSLVVRMLNIVKENNETI